MKKRQPRLTMYRPVVWVMGASRGIGKHIAIQFSTIGCEVCVSSRSSKELQSVVREIQELGGRAYSFPCDMRKQKQILSTAGKIRNQLSRIDVLINNAGITSFKKIEEEPLESINEILATNLNGPISCIKAVLEGMIQRKNGTIINILSTVAVKTFPGSAAYTAAKEGLFGFAKVLREEVRRHNIKVINILPGATETEMWHPKLRTKHGYRMMTPEAVGEAVLSLYRMPDTVVAEDIVLRPILGDIDS